MSKSENKTTVIDGNIFIELLTVLFIGLKLTGYINWSWWWVLGPLWIIPAFVLGTMIVVLVVMAVISGLTAIGAGIRSVIS